MATPSDDIDTYLKECLQIVPEALQEEFVRTPGDFAYWNDRYKDAVEAHLRAKANRERVGARVYLVKSAEGSMPGTKPPTVDKLKALVESDDDYIEVGDAEISAEVEMVRLKGVLEAIRTKRDMLIQIGAQVRQEMQHDPMTRTK